MNLLYGLKCHWEALKIMKAKKSLIFWGLLRFLIILFLFIVLSFIALSYNHLLLEYIWTKPSSLMMLILWKIALVLLTILLLFVAGGLSYLISQILFGVVIADHMSYITEHILSGKEPKGTPPFSFSYLLFLIKQEIPRGTLPLLVSSSFIILGWLLPLGFIWVMVSSLVSCAFLAWDYTDLVPARMLKPFKERFTLFKRTFWGHVIFGLPFMIPFINVLFFSIGPVSGTVFYMRASYSK